MEQLDFFNTLEQTKPVCPVCGNSFEKNVNYRKYCSQECAFKKHIKYERIKTSCIECGNVFEKSITNKFKICCSVICNIKHRDKNKLKVKNICTGCGNVFEQYKTNKLKKYCSEVCYQKKYNRDKNKLILKEKKKEFSYIKPDINIIHYKHDHDYTEFCPSTVNVSFGSWEHCLYCGELPNSQDHVIPFSYYSIKERKPNAGSSEGVKVKACMECNSLLSNKYFSNIIDRIEDVKNSIYKRNRKVLKNKEWDDYDLDELNYTLKTKVLSVETKRRIAKRRIDWITSEKGIHYLDNIKSQVKDQFGIDHFLRKFFCC